MQRTLTHTEHDISDGEVNSPPWDGNASHDMSNAPTGPVTHSKSKGQNLTAKDFVIMSQGINWSPDSWKNVYNWFERS